MPVPQISPVLTLTSVHTWYEESTPWKLLRNEVVIDQHTMTRLTPHDANIYFHGTVVVNAPT